MWCLVVKNTNDDHFSWAKRVLRLASAKGLALTADSVRYLALVGEGVPAGEGLGPVAPGGVRRLRMGVMWRNP